jgi:hypothetical protein
MSCYLLQDCEHLEKIEQVLQIDLKSKLVECITTLIQSDVDPMILDIALEGLSCIWLRYPEKILEQQSVLEKVIEKFNSTNSL